MRADLKKLVEIAKKSLYFRCVLQADEKQVTIEKRMSSESKMAYLIYLDGHWKGEWFVNEEHRPMVEKYFPPKKKRTMSLKNWKSLSARTRKEYPEFFIYYTPHSSSLSTILNHLSRTCESIQVVESFPN